MASKKASRRPSAALAVGIGILLSRLIGFLRDRALAYFLGDSLAAGAFRAALRIPNFLQNLFGEGSLSASFIPVYARLLSEGREDEARRVASIIFSILAVTVTIIVALGVTFAQQITDVLASGFHGEVKALTVELVRIVFPGTGMLVLSAWCLGVLNSHRRFFLSYTAPVVWSLAIIVALLVFGPGRTESSIGRANLASLLAWATVCGAALQFLIQLPAALRLTRGMRPSLAMPPQVRQVMRSFAPATISRGVMQISAFIDQILATYLGAGIVADMAYAQTIYMLPVSLFGMAISAAELPSLSSVTGSHEEMQADIKIRLVAGLRRIAFFIVPSVVAFILLGEVIVALLFRTGHFGDQATHLVWLILCGSSIGLLASTQGRLCVSVFWALQDTRTPMNYAIVRVALTAVLGYVVVFPLRALVGWPEAYSAAGLLASAGLCGWVEFMLIRRGLIRRIGPFSMSGAWVARYWGAALVAGALAYGAKLILTGWPGWLAGLTVIGIYGFVYFGITYALGAPDARDVLGRVLGRVGLGKGAAAVSETPESRRQKL